VPNKCTREVLIIVYYIQHEFECLLVHLNFNETHFQLKSIHNIFFYKEVKSYWTTDRSHLRSEWIHFQPFKYRCRAGSSELYPKHFTAHRFFNGHKSRMGIQVPQSAWQVHQWDDVFPTGIFHITKSSGPMSHNHLHAYASDLQHSKSTKNRIYLTEQCPLLLLALKPRPKCHTWKNRMGEYTSIRRVPFWLPCSY
jgi:hypothetical protein